MLERLLDLLATGRMASVAELARELGASEPLVVGMLEDLARRGLLEVVEGCQVACDRCGVKGCAVAPHGRAFAVSDAGRAYMRRFS